MPSNTRTRQGYAAPTDEQPYSSEALTFCVAKILGGLLDAALHSSQDLRITAWTDILPSTTIMLLERSCRQGRCDITALEAWLMFNMQVVHISVCAASHSKVCWCALHLGPNLQYLPSEDMSPVGRTFPLAAA